MHEFSREMLQRDLAGLLLLMIVAGDGCQEPVGAELLYWLPPIGRSAWLEKPRISNSYVGYQILATNQYDIELTD